MPVMSNQRPIVVIEPHPDDAYLSLGWHLEKLWAGRRRTIVTVYSDTRRTAEGRAYADAVGASHVALGLAETRLDGEYTGDTENALAAFLEGLRGKSETDLYVPLGLQHPDHKRVAATAWDSWPGGMYYRYLDAPYMTKLMLAADLYAATAGRKVRSIAFPPKTKWKHTGLFKSQAKFFHFNPVQDWKLPEIVLA